MSRHLGLKSHVKRRLKRLGNRKPLPTIISGIYDHSGAEVIGLQGNGVAVMRAGLQETLGHLQARAAT